MSQFNGDTAPRDHTTDLPPVEPPTAGFIIQLFVIPALVVAVVVVVWLLFGRLAGGERDAMDYVKLIRSENPNRRWRAAYELASLIQNEPKLASDSALLGELTALLDTELARPKPDPDDETTRYLTYCLGAFKSLNARTASGQQVDPLATLALALEPKQPMTVRTAAAQSLGRLGAALPGGLTDETAVSALIRASTDPDPTLRQRACYTLGYCHEETVVEALRDRIRQDEDRITRYNAAAALARRDDPNALDTLREMLSPADLTEIVQGDSPSEASRRTEGIMLEAIWSLRDAVKAKHTELARALRPSLTALSQSKSPGVRLEAENLLKATPTAP
ncbi:MAG: HEAT repeat domain-containing protein [Isosphaeraceae bacterium]